MDPVMDMKRQRTIENIVVHPNTSDNNSHYRNINNQSSIHWISFMHPSIPSKSEKIISQWCNKWLSRGGRLVLVKSMLEAIPIYCHTLANIPKGILENIRKYCFNFMW